MSSSRGLFTLVEISDKFDLSVNMMMNTLLDDKQQSLTTINAVDIYLAAINKSRIINHHFLK